MGRWRGVLVAGFVLLGAGSGCGDGDSTGTVGDDPLADRTLVVTGVTVAREPYAVVPGSQLRLTFEGGTLGMDAGCNRLSGEYRVDGDRLVVGGIGGTEMGCAEELMAQDAWLAGLFAEPVVLDAEPLTLTAGDTVLTLADREEVAPDRPLVGTRWALDGLVDGDAVSSVPQGVQASLEVGEQGRVVLSTGCNGGGGRVRVGPGVLTWDVGPVTLADCEPPEGDVERHVLSVLDGDTAYAVDGATLTITRGRLGLLLRAA